MKTRLELVTVYGVASFPRLMINRDRTLVVFFYSGKEGTVVYCSDKRIDLGFYNDEWEMDQFNEFKGQVILEND